MDTANFEPQSDLPWKKSSKSGTGNCVEVAITSKNVFVRTSRDQSGPRLQFSLDEWRCFVIGVKFNEFDLPA